MNTGWRHAPAFRSALMLAGGIILQDSLSLQASPVFLVSLCCIALLLLLFLLSRRHFSLFIGPLLCFALGVSLAAGDRLTLRPLPERCFGEKVGVEGTIAQISRQESRRIRLVLDEVALGAQSSVLPVRGAVVVVLTRGRSDPVYPDLIAGMRLRVRGIFYPIVGPRNPGEVDLRRWARAGGLVGEVMGRPPDEVTILDPRPGGSIESIWMYPLRRALLDQIDRSIGGDEGELLKGLLIGERTGLSAGISDDFVRAGVAHVLAVSGSNVAVVAGFMGFLLSLTGMGRPLRSVLLAAFLVGYMLLSGGQPPVVRATIMAMVALAAVALGEEINVLNALGVSAIIILTINSQTLFDIGFQLSFAAVLSLIVLYPRISLAIDHLQGTGLRVRIARGALRVMGVTLAATLGTLPLAAGVFGRVSLVGLVANLVVVPATGMSVLLGGLAAFLAPLSDHIASLYAAANWGLLRFTLRFTHLCASPEWASPLTTWFSPIHTLPYLALLQTVFSLGSPVRFRRSLIATFGLTIVAAWSSSFSPAREELSRLRVTMLDVGQGDAILVDLPGAGHCLVDCGPADPLSDAGLRTIGPYLSRRRIDTLDWIIVTHGHRDHVGGLRSLIQSVCVREIGAPPYLASRLSAEIGREVRPLASGDAIGLGPAIRCHVLSPLPSGRRQPAGNDGSVVLRLQYGSTALLLPGDAGSPAEEGLVRRFGDFLRAQCLKVAHHGSASGTSDSFLSAVRPEYSLISVGRNNRFRHPSQTTMERLRTRGGRIWRTDLAGACVLESDGVTFSIGR